MEKYGLVWEKRKDELERELAYKKIVLEEREDLRIPGGMWSPGHVILEGDNLLCMSYLESVGDKADVILSDPPYNTFGNLTYSDGRKNKEDEYEHSEWLNFMDVRMRKAYDLLSDDGVIFVTIDDRMMFHLKLLMDSIFGRKNFICNFIWKKKMVPSYQTTNNLSTTHEYILMYGKDKSRVKFKVGDIRAGSVARDYVHEDERGIYRLNSMKGGASRANSKKNKYIITSPNGHKFEAIWQLNEESFKEQDADGRIHWGEDDGKRAPYRKTYIDEVKGLPMVSILDSRDVGFTATGTVELGGILGETGIFDFPKPSKLFKFLVGRLDFGRDDIHVVDMFSGSGTTGHAILDLNKESNEVFRFTLMNVPEESGDIKNICEEVTYERVSRLMRGYENKGGKRMKKKMGKLSYYKVLLEDKE